MNLQNIRDKVLEIMKDFSPRFLGPDITPDEINGIVSESIGQESYVRKGTLGELDNLATTDQSNVVAAINEVNDKALAASVAAGNVSDKIGTLTGTGATGDTVTAQLKNTNDKLGNTADKTTTTGDQLTYRINKLSADLYNHNMILDNKNIVILGDSNAYNYQNTNFLENSLKSVTVQKLAVGGATFADTGNSILSQLNNITGTPDYIIIWCGNNDIAEWCSGTYTHIGHPDYRNMHTWTQQNRQTMFGACNYLLGYIRANYPKAKVLGILRTYTTIRQDSRVKYAWFTINKLFQKWNCGVLDLEKTGNITEFIPQSKSENLIDSVHYSNDTLKYFNSKIIGELQTGCNGTTEIENNVFYCDDESLAGDTIKCAVYNIRNCIPFSGNDIPTISHFISWNIHDLASSKCNVSSVIYSSDGLGSFKYLDWEHDLCTCKYKIYDSGDIKYICSRDDGVKQINNSFNIDTLTIGGKYFFISTDVPQGTFPNGWNPLNSFIEIYIPSVVNPTEIGNEGAWTTRLQKLYVMDGGVPNIYYRRYYNGWSVWRRYSGVAL